MVAFEAVVKSHSDHRSLGNVLIVMSALYLRPMCSHTCELREAQKLNLLIMFSLDSKHAMSVDIIFTQLTQIRKLE